MDLRREHRWDDPAEGWSGPDALFASDEHAERARREAQRHVTRFMEIVRKRAENGGEPEYAPKEFYLIRGGERFVRELLGFRLQGHPYALVGAFDIPAHPRSPIPNGRHTIAQFLSSPPRSIPRDGTAVPAGLVEVRLPRLGEPIAEFVERLRSTPEEEDDPPVRIDSSLIRFAFDFRFKNPSEQQHLKTHEQPTRNLFRTVEGYVLTGISRGLHKSLNRDAKFLTITSVRQHMPGRTHPLPTLALHADCVTIEMEVNDAAGGHSRTLAFHPSTSLDAPLLGYPARD